MVEKFNFTINGKPVTVEVEPEMMVLDVIREVLNLTGTKHGCDNSTCGTCTILVNGKAVKSCNLPVKRIEGAEVITVEGLAKGTELHPVRNRDGVVWLVGRKAGCHADRNGNSAQQTPLPLHRIRTDPRRRINGAKADPGTQVTGN